jgi:hypothetical protein
VEYNIYMCPNCIVGGSWVWLGPGLICLGFAALAFLMYKLAKDQGEFDGDEEDAKYAVFNDRI